MGVDKVYVGLRKTDVDIVHIGLQKMDVGGAYVSRKRWTWSETTSVYVR